MSNCKEFVFDKLMAIAAIPVADFPVESFGWQLSPVIHATALSFPTTNAITIGTRPIASGGLLVPIKQNTGEVKDSENGSVAGRAHFVTVSCEIDTRNATVWSPLQTLERMPFHLVIFFYGFAAVFVAATKDTYSCEVGRDGDKTTVSFKIQNLMGLQTIVGIE